MSSPQRPDPASDGPPPHPSSRAWDRTAAPAATQPTAHEQALLRPLLGWLRRLPGRALHPSTLRDRALVRRIHRALGVAPALDDLGHVRLYVAHGVVTLGGRVASDEVRHALVRRVRSVRGVREVVESGLSAGLQ